MDNNIQSEKTRTLQDSTSVPELDKAITLNVYTKCPEKYLLTDLETGQIYKGSTNPDKMWTKIQK